MNSTPIFLLSFVLSVAPAFATENPVFQELLDKGVAMSDDAVVKLSPPILPDGLDVASQKVALAKLADARTKVKDLLKRTPYAPVYVKVRSAKPLKDDGPTVRKIDLGFVAYGDWNVLTSKDFLGTAVQAKDEGPSRVVIRSGFLNDAEMASRKLSAIVNADIEERFLYSTFRLFDRVQISATRFSAMTRSKESILAAGRLDPRFLDDKDFPNEWRPLVRDERAEIKPGSAHPFAHAGGYAKITRLAEPADGVFIECHIVYEEPYGWFDGVNLVGQKIPLMVNEKVKVFRRKLTSASEKK
jgi:hypothetical protein